LREATTFAIDFAQGRVSAYDVKAMGATIPPKFAPPGLWHSIQFSWRIGITSLAYVMRSAAEAVPQVAATAMADTEIPSKLCLIIVEFLLI
jgi:hypothetical protein